jgi:hypothetical protein
MSKARVKPNSSFLKKKNQKSGLLIGEIKVKSCVGMKLRKSATSAKSGTFSPEFKNKTAAPAVAPAAPEVVQTTTIIPAPAPSQSTDNILFDLTSFDRNFDSQTGYIQEIFPDPHNPPEYLPLNEKIKNALIRAANRWAHFLCFTPEYIDLIRTFLPEWNGIRLARFQMAEVNDPTTNKPWGSTLARSQPIVKVPQTSLIERFFLYLNKNTFNELSETKLFHLLSHELGHVLGFPCMVVKNNGEEVLPKITFDSARNIKFYEAETFPTAWESYKYEYQGLSVIEKGGTTTTYHIPLSTDSQHWSPDTITYDTPISYNEPHLKLLYRGINNDILTQGWNSEIKYLISNVTLGVLSDVYTWLDSGDKTYNYRINYKNAHEVETFTTTRDDKSIFFIGEVYDPKNKEIKIEDDEEEEKDKSLSKGPIIHQCSVCEPIYLDACGDCA